VSDQQPKILKVEDLLSQPAGQGWEEVQVSLPPLGILASLSNDSLVTLASYGRYEEFPADEIVIRENEHLERFYVVVSGMLEVFTESNSTHLVLHYAEPGECLGEVSLLDPGPATATVRTRTASRLWSMGLEELRQFLQKHVGMGGALMLGMAQCLAVRIRHTDKLILKSQEQPKLTNIIRSEPPIKATVPAPPVTGGFFSSLKRSLGGSGGKPHIPTEIKM